MTAIIPESVWLETSELFVSTWYSALFLCAAMCMKVAKRHLKDTAKMDDDNKAMCYALRHPAGGGKPFPLQKIEKLDRN